MIHIRADKNNLTITQNELLTSGSANVYFVQFDLSADWCDLTKIVCWRIIGELPPVEIEVEPLPPSVEDEGELEGQLTIDPVTAVDTYLDDDWLCVVPYSMTLYPGVEVEIGIYGVDPVTQQIILPTIWKSLGTVVQGVQLSNASDLKPPEINLPEGGGLTAVQVVNIIQQYQKENPVEYNTIVGAPEPLTNKQLEEILK